MLEQQPGATPGADTSRETVRGVQRWLHVMAHTDPRYGGISAAVPALAASLAVPGQRELLVAAFCHAGEEYRPELLRQQEISFWPNSRLAWWRDQALSRQFEALIRDVDGVHVHGLWEQSTAIACRLARRTGKPYILSAHGMLEPWALNAKRLKKQLYAALIERANVAEAACLHALTAAEAEQYRSFGARGPITVIPNAVNVPQQVSSDAFFQQFPALRGKRLVLFLSRLHPKKGLDLLLEAWSGLRARHPEAHLVLAGSGDEPVEAGLRTLVRDQNMETSVSFTGLLAGGMKWSALKAAEVFVLPSYSEGLSMALLEAMGMGLPVIATHACNMPEITATGAGWEIEASADALTESLDVCLTRRPTDNAATGQNGTRLLAARYTPTQVVQQTVAMYDAVLEGKHSQQVPARIPSGAR